MKRAKKNVTRTGNDFWYSHKLCDLVSKYLFQDHKKYSITKLFHATDVSLYSIPSANTRKPEDQRFSDVFRVYRERLDICVGRFFILQNDLDSQFFGLIVEIIIYSF